MNLEEYINDLCLKIQTEKDAYKLLQLIERLDSVLYVKEWLLAKMGKQTKLG